ncbi:aspartoacylase [Salinimonas sp. HHU 13199]|uniref:Aspartoacylase n=1 Tax=Salinimonas profundi TaxID=2729140 RepID=A0ABR8LPR6_9ALTE|nr:aspartoacylase [Salinimonas profundi]MBD3586099.1 aspartoacylase [Salinimonas profundi]
MLNSIVILGGTHGNETSGIQLVRHWQNHNLPERFSALAPQMMLVNQQAIEANVRYVDDDLNRQFTEQRLDQQSSDAEARLARHLNQTMGPKNDPKTDFVIDIHNTTSAMGATLIILQRDDFNIQLARYVKHHMPEANILLEDDKAYAEHPYLCTVGKQGVMVEVGGQPQGVLREDIFQLTQTLTETILDFCIAYNAQTLPELAPCDVFRLGENISFPLDETGARTAMIHHSLQDNDFQPLLPGAPVFKCFDGTEITWDQEAVTYPHFINEAAYAKTHVAFATASQVTL